MKEENIKEIDMICDEMEIERFISKELTFLSRCNFIDERSKYKFENTFHELCFAFNKTYINFIIYHFLENNLKNSKEINYPYGFFKKTIYEMIGSRENVTKFNRLLYISTLKGDDF